MKRRNKYKAAIIGCGRIGCQFDRYKPGYPFTHLSAYRSSRKVEVIAVCDAGRNKAMQVALDNGIPFFFSDMKRMLKEVKPDLISICTPDDTHYPCIKEVLSCPSVKGVWCEKPLAVTMAQGREIANLCRKRNVKLLVNHLRRYDLFYQQIKKGIPEYLGKIQNVVCYYTGGIVTTGSHLIDILNYLFGRCVSVSGKIIKGNGEIFGELVYEKGLRVSLIPCDNNHFLAMDMIILGLKGRLDTINRPFVQYDYRYFPAETDRRTGSRFIGRKDKEIISRKLKRDFFVRALSELIDCIEKGKKPSSSGDEALKALEIIAALSYSAHNNGKTMRLPFKELDFGIPKAQGDVRKWKS